MADGRQEDAYNLTSENFDAELSLANPSEVALGFPGVAPFPRLNDCIPLLPPDMRAEVLQGGWLQDAAPKSEEQKARDAAKAAFVRQRSAQYALDSLRAARYNPIQAIADRVRAGPLILLRQVYTKREQVDIVLRNARGIRGVMRATLCGFDKYFNMLLADGHEVFVVRERVIREKVIQTAHTTELDNPAMTADLESASNQVEPSMAGHSAVQPKVKTRVGWKQDLRQRRVSRIVLMGDQVVVIYRSRGIIRLPGRLGLRFNEQVKALFV